MSMPEESVQNKVYTITYDLSNVTCNNSDLEINEHENYIARIRAITGYSTNSITVTMGGDDITDECVSGVSIDIPDVTGDIIIKAIGIEK